MQINDFPPPSDIREFISYDAATGAFYWLKGKHAGKLAGFGGKRGYWRIKFRQRDYRAHRLAWYFVTGEWPVGEIDHINRVRSDNRAANLRPADRFEQAQNVTIQGQGVTRFRGVRWRAKYRVWCAKIKARKREFHLGTFNNQFDAARAYDSAAEKHFGAFAVLNFPGEVS